MSKRPESEARGAFGVDWELPQVFPYQEALKLVEDLSQEMRVNYAVMGSLAVAICSNRQWEPFRNIPSSDIDVFLMEDYWKKQEFGCEYAKVKLRPENRLLPRVDFFNTERLIKFADGIPYLRTGSRRQCWISKEMFQTYPVLVSGVEVPVLHPRVSLAVLDSLMRVYSTPVGGDPVSREKIKASRKELAQAVKENPLGFAEFSQKMLDDFNYYFEFRCLRRSL